MPAGRVRVPTLPRNLHALHTTRLVCLPLSSFHCFTRSVGNASEREREKEREREYGEGRIGTKVRHVDCEPATRGKDERHSKLAAVLLRRSRFERFGDVTRDQLSWIINETTCSILRTKYRTFAITNYV